MSAAPRASALRLARCNPEVCSLPCKAPVWEQIKQIKCETLSLAETLNSALSPSHHCREITSPESASERRPADVSTPSFIQSPITSGVIELWCVAGRSATPPVPRERRQCAGLPLGITRGFSPSWTASQELEGHGTLRKGRIDYYFNFYYFPPF